LLMVVVVNRCSFTCVPPAYSISDSVPMVAFGRIARKYWVSANFTTGVPEVIFAVGGKVPFLATRVKAPLRLRVPEVFTSL